MILARPVTATLVGGLVCALVAVGAFVADRNAATREHGEAMAAKAAASVAERQVPSVPTLATGLVEPPRAPARWPFLRRRSLAWPDVRPLGGPQASDLDKLISDAAASAERGGASVRVLRDGTGRVVATRPTGQGTAVAVLAAPQPASAAVPLMLVTGALILSLGLARFVKWPVVALAPLVVLAGLWGDLPAAAAALMVAAATTIADRRGAVALALEASRRHRIAYSYLLPAALGMGVLVLVPFAIGVALGFFEHAQGSWHFVGLHNFQAILSGGGRPLGDPLNFWFTLGVTIAWTSINVALHVTIGVVLALALRERWFRLRGFFRVLLILPWAIPNYITALLWRGMFQRQYGAVNRLLDLAGLGEVSWFSQFATAFFANVVTNTWLGFPFMMLVSLAALETIPRDLYEAAEVDGASPWQRFVYVTLPHLAPALLPAVLLGAIWTFNMFNVIYLVSDGKPAGSTDILITQAYRWAFERGQRYGMAAAYATIIFVLLAAWTFAVSRATRRKEAA